MVLAGVAVNIYALWVSGVSAWEIFFPRCAIGTGGREDLEIIAWKKYANAQTPFLEKDDFSMRRIVKIQSGGKEGRG